MTAITRPRTWSLALKVPLTVTLVVAAVAVTIGLVLVEQERERIRSELGSRVMLTARSVAAAARGAVLRNDYWGLHKILTLITGEGGDTGRVLSASILDNHGRILAHLDPVDNPLDTQSDVASGMGREGWQAFMKKGAARTVWHTDQVQGAIRGLVPVQSGGVPIGAVSLTLSTEEISRRTLEATLSILGVALLLGLCGIGLGVLASNRMIRPLHALTRGMETVGRGELANVAPVKARDRDEIGQLVDTFNRMAEELAEKKELERQLATGEKLSAIGRIAAGVAHEVNNPLAGMLNCLDTIRRHPEDGELVRRYLPMIEKGLNRIRAIVQGLLIELKVEGGEVQPDQACFDDLKDLIRAEIGDRPITLIWDNRTPAGFGCGRLQPLVLNLLRNAIEALDDSGTVAFRSRLEMEGLVIEVEDDGRGIPPENLERLFDPFYTTRNGGTGLGLWIAYRVVETLKGGIEVESEPGRGTLFRVRIPRSGLASAPGAGSRREEA